MGKIAGRWIAGLTILWIALAVRADEAVLKEVRALDASGKKSQAFEKLQGIKDQKFSESELHLKYFTLGALANELGKYREARDYLNKSLELKTSEDAYVHYLLGHGYKRESNYKEALKHLNKSLSLKPPRNIVYQVRFEISEISMNQKHWKTAYKHLKYLERRWRNTYRHPEVIWRLISVDLNRKRKWRACRWARKIYSKYPAHALVYDWGAELHKSPFEGQNLGCMASVKDQKSRIRRLQWSGESDRARKELAELKERARNEAQTFEVDQMLADFLIREGFVDEALKTLTPYYEKNLKNFSFLMLFGKSAARAGEFPAAVGAYYKAHKLNRRSRSGRKALFSAAFLSYQFKDYDGAARKFEEFTKRYKRSGLSRDAEYHLAWIKYLKGNYKGAVKAFETVLHKKKKWRRWRWWDTSKERITYWLAMSYLRLENYQKARPLFQKLQSDKLMGYYSIAAKYRLDQIPNKNQDRKLTSVDESADSEESTEGLAMPDTILPQPESLPVAEEDEGEDSLVSTPDSEDNESQSVADSDEEEDEEQEDRATSFKNPQLQKRFDRAQDFISVGLYDWAKWELYEIERRTRNLPYLRRLVSSYEEIESYNRSTFICFTYFKNERKRLGVHGVREPWECAYPRAFKESVTKYGDKFGVPAEFAWSIMRAESHFRKDVISPVGAKGLMQLMPNTANQVARLLGDSGFAERQLVEPDVNIRLGTRYLSRLLKKFDQQIPIAAAAYNAGPHRAEGWLSIFGHLETDEFIEHIPFVETRNYVKKVTRNFAIYKELYGRDEISMAWLSKPIPVKITNPARRETWEKLE